MSARGLLIAGQRSGAGKTTLTVGLLAAFKRRGSRVRGAKAGPDYIDPAFHQAACGSPSLNLDSWAMPPSLLDAIVSDATSGIDLLLVESAMGLFDGVAGGEGRTGSAADLAARFNIPVLLVLDVSGQAQTAAAVARERNCVQCVVGDGRSGVQNRTAIRIAHDDASAIRRTGDEPPVR